MNKYKKYIFIIVILLLLLVSYFLYKNMKSSYGYFSNVGIARTIVSNVSSFYYDRESYIQYDDSYINNSIKRSNGYYYPEDANINNNIYMDNISFISNIFYTGFDYDIKDIFGSLDIDSIYSYGDNIYSNALDKEDDRVNNHNIDYYDNTVTTTTATIGGELDYHILVMYVNNKNIDKDNVYNLLLDTLIIGDIIVYDNKLLLYVGNNKYIYCTGNSYDYINKKDNREDRAIVYGNIDDLNNNSNDNYLFNSDKFYVYRILNRYGTWKLTKYYNNMKDYYSNNILPKIKIERYNNKKDVYMDDEIVYTLKIYNNSDDKIIIPNIREELGSNIEYISNDYKDEAYSNNVLSFDNIEIDSNSYKEINYIVKVINSEGYVKSNKAMIGDYYLNSINNRIGKRINVNKIINNYNKYNSPRELYNDLYDIDVDINNIWDNVIDNDNNYIDGYSLLVDGLYGGIDINNGNNRKMYIDKDMLITGDLIFYNNDYVMYIDDGINKYLYNYKDKRIINDIDNFLDSLLGMNRFMVIRESYLYNKNDIFFNNLDIDYDNYIIRLNTSDTYSNIINNISGYKSISIKDKDDNDIDINDIVKSGDKIIIDDDTYYISLLGDINGDGYIDTADVLKLHRFVIKRSNIDELYYLYSSYINDDDNIDTADVLKLHRYVIKKIDSLR